MDGQPRRPESRAPNGPNALRAYVPARMRTAETFPSASWAFFCAADVDADADDDDEEDNEVEVEKGRRRCGACVRSRPRRNVVTIIFVWFLYSFLRDRESAPRMMSWLVVTLVRGRRGLTFGWVGRRTETESLGLPGGPYSHGGSCAVIIYWQ